MIDRLDDVAQFEKKVAPHESGATLQISHDLNRAPARSLHASSSRPQQSTASVRA
jgi:hypothetical protein